MPARGVRGLIGRSITVKISLVILIIETTLLCVMGVYYFRSFNAEISERLSEKMALPGALMSQLALNFEAVNDFAALEELVQEKVVDAFIVKKDGRVYYSADPSRIGKSYTGFVNPEERLRVSDDIFHDQTGRYRTEEGGQFLSIFSPIEVNGNLLGFLYLKIHAETLEARKQNIIHIFIIGSLITIVLTTLIEALWVHHLFVPRIDRTASTLREVETGDYSARVLPAGSPDQIGGLMENVNSMIERIEFHTADLQALMRAGEDLAAAPELEDITRIVVRTLREGFLAEPGTRCVLSPETNATLDTCYPEMSELGPSRQEMLARGEILQSGDRLYVPVFRDQKVSEVLCFSPGADRVKLGKGSDSFLKTLSRLATIAVTRTESQVRLRQAEKEYRDLFSNAVEGIFRTTPGGKLLAANASLAAMLGYGSPEEMLANTDDVTSHYLLAGDRALFIRRLEKEDRVRGAQFQLRRRDGSSFWAMISAHAVRDGTGAMAGIEGGIIDISEKKKREEAENRRKIAETAHRVKSELLAVLERKNRELEEALATLQQTRTKLLQSEKMAAIGTMAGGVAHDLNNILSGIVGYPDLLLMRLPEGSDLRSSVEVIKESGTRAAAVVSDLLTLARGVAYNTVIFDINHLVEKHLQSAEYEQLRLRFPGVRLSSRLAEDILYAKCSPVHIQKVIMNLVTNAFEAINTKGAIVITTGNVTVGSLDAMTRSVAPGEYVVLRVSDSGPGISEKDLDHIFEPFYTKKLFGRSGTGLGLAVVWNTMREHGGTATAKSDENGATFSIYLPASRKGAPAEDDGDSSLAELKGTGTVLVVDDESMLRRIADTMLTTLGYTAVSVSSGEEAVDYLRENPADLVLLDMLMPPGMDGYETYRRIAGIKPAQKTIITSGYAEHNSMAKARELGIGSFLKKPYTIEQLGQAVKNELG
jgi:PAS domain S-box-containing protein